jgi:hypothetical protein
VAAAASAAVKPAARHRPDKLPPGERQQLLAEVARLKGCAPEALVRRSVAQLRKMLGTLRPATSRAAQQQVRSARLSASLPFSPGSNLSPSLPLSRARSRSRSRSLIHSLTLSAVGRP